MCMLEANTIANHSSYFTSNSRAIEWLFQQLWQILRVLQRLSSVCDRLVTEVLVSVKDFKLHCGLNINGKRMTQSLCHISKYGSGCVIAQKAIDIHSWLEDRDCWQEQVSWKDVAALRRLRCACHCVLFACVYRLIRVSFKQWGS